MSLITTPTHKDADSYATLEEADDYFKNFSFADDDDNYDYWHNKSEEVRERALKGAAKIIDRFRFFGSKFYDYQKLQFPRDNAKMVSGSPDSGAVGYLIDNDLSASATDNDYDDDYFKHWCCEITDGTNEYEKRQITAFDRTTGKVTVDSSFPLNLDTTSQYLLIEKVPDDVKFAQCEIALWLLKGKNRTGRAKLQAEGVTSFSLGELSENFGPTKDVNIPKEAEEYLKKYISKIGSFE